MTSLEAGMNAPDFNAPAMQGSEEIGTLSLSNFKGKKLVLFFYPKDDTPGCTKESCAFRDEKAEFSAVGAEIVGISKDPMKKHGKFIGKYDLNFPLISDEETSICEDYGVWVEKNMYGKKYMGIERSTFLIDENGKILKVWNKVKVDGHVDDVLNSIKSLQQDAA